MIGVFTDSIKKICLAVDKINGVKKRLMGKYFRRSLTIIFDKNAHVPDLLTANKFTIGVSVSDHKIVLEILVF